MYYIFNLRDKEIVIYIYNISSINHYINIR